MIGLPANTRIWIAAGVTDMRCGFNSLAAKVQTALERDPYGGHVFIFRGRRGDLLKALYCIRPRTPVIEGVTSMLDDSPIAMTGGYSCRKRRSCLRMRRM
jgi:transposase